MLEWVLYATGVMMAGASRARVKDKEAEVNKRCGCQERERERERERASTLVVEASVPRLIWPGAGVSGTALANCAA